MYVPKSLEETRREVLHRLVHEHPFGALITLGPGGLEANHLPMVLEAAEGPFGTLRAHIARANPLWRETNFTREVLVLFQGPHAYVSPDWYPSKQETGKAVPTWNYAVVHAYGPLRVAEDAAWLRAHLEALTRRHESGREPGWQISDAPADYIDKLMGAIVGIEIPIARLVGKWKLNQNRSAADVAGVIDGLEREGAESAAAVARLMRERTTLMGEGGGAWR